MLPHKKHKEDKKHKHHKKRKRHDSKSRLDKRRRTIFARLPGRAPPVGSIGLSAVSGDPTASTAAVSGPSPSPALTELFPHVAMGKRSNHC